jgi:hypothetical protein
MQTNTRKTLAAMALGGGNKSGRDQAPLPFLVSSPIDNYEPIHK